MLLTVRISSAWRQLFRWTKSRHRRSECRVFEAAVIEILEARTLLTVLAAATIDSMEEDYRDFNFDIHGDFSGTTFIPKGYINNQGELVDYHDSYHGSVDSGSGSVSFTSPSEGSGSGFVFVSGKGADNSGAYDFSRSEGGSADVNNGNLVNILTSTGFDIAGSFSSQTFGANVVWTGHPFGPTSISTGSFSGYVTDENTDKTDFDASVTVDASGADAIHDSGHSPRDVAAAITATITISVSGQFMHSPSMATAVTHAHIYLGAVSPANELIDPIDIHWNTDTITVKLSDFVGHVNDIGDGKIHVVFDPEGAVDEADESNNDQTFDLDLFNLSASGISWGADGSALALFNIDVGGLTNAPGVATTVLEIYFADADGNFLDATPGDNVINPLSNRIIGEIDQPETTDGQFLLPTLPLTWRPDGATQLLAVIDRIIPPNFQSTTDDDVADLPLTELTVNHMQWNGDGSVSANVAVDGITAVDTTVGLYWGFGSTGNFTSLQKITDDIIPAVYQGGLPLQYAAGRFGTPPAGATAIVVIADPAKAGLPLGLIPEPNENDNSFYLPLNPPDHLFDDATNLELHSTLNSDGKIPWTFLPVAGAGPQHGTLSIGLGGSFAYTPDQDYLGDDSFQYYLHAAGGGDSLPATVTLHVLPADYPTVLDIAFQIPAGHPLNGQVHGTDPHNSPLTFVVSSSPQHGDLQLAADGSFTYTPFDGESGPDSFTYVANNGSADSSPRTISLTVQATNLPPEANPASYSFSADHGNNLIDQLTGSDPEAQSLTFAVDSTPMHGYVGIQPDGSFYYIPFAQFNGIYTGPDSFTFTVSDGVNTSAPATVNIQITSSPIVPEVFDFSKILSEDTSLRYFLPVFDGAGLPDTYSVTQSPAHGSLVIQLNGQFTYQPNKGFVGSDSFSFTASNAYGSSAPATFSLQVDAAPNLPPVANNRTFTLPQGQPLSGQMTGFDPENQPFTISVVQMPSHGNLTIQQNGMFTYTPVSNFSGADNFKFTVNDGRSTSAQATIQLQVNSVVNQVPQATSGNFSLNEGDQINSKVTGNDPENQLLTFAVGTLPAHGALGFLNNGTFTYTPNNNYSGPDSFTFTVNDGVHTSTPATINLQVNAVNQAPAAGSTSALAKPGVPLNGQLLGNDPEGQPLTFAVVNHPSNGIVQVQPNGAYTYTSTSGYLGDDSFTFAVSDGVNVSQAATISITVSSVNQPPVANANSFSVSQGSPLQNQLSGSDPENHLLTYTVAQQPQHGNVQIQTNGAFTYTPTGAYTGPDSFTFTVNDGVNTSAAATISLQVNAVANQPPVANAHSYSITAGATLNDQLTGSDPENHALTYAVAQQPQRGNVQIQTNGAFTYAPTGSDSGSDSFTFTVNDGVNTSAPATISLQINAVVNQPPVANAHSYSITAGATLNDQLTGSDPENHALTYAVAQQPQHGNVQIQTNGAFTYAPTGSDSGSDSFTFTVNDGVNTSAPATISLTINGTNRPPLINDQSFNILENSAVSTIVGIVLSSDPDVGDTLTYNITGGNSLDAFSINSQTGSIAVANSALLDFETHPAFSLTVQVTDSHGLTGTGTMTVNLADINDVPQLILNGGAVAFGAKAAKKGGPVHVAPNITVVDPDQSAAFKIGGGTLTLSIDASGKQSKKGVTLNDSIGGLSGASSLGTTTGPAFSNGKLSLTVHLSGSTTATAIQAFLRGVTFTTKGAGLKQTHRILLAQVTDMAGATSNQLSQTVNITK
jgi:VCBS repeat-containing protein